MATAQRTLWTQLKRKRLALISVFILILVTAVAIFAPLIAPFDPQQTSLRARLLPPGSVQQARVHLLGTDALGRDLLSQLIYGARISLLVGLLSVILGGTLGILLGTFAGYLGGAVDALIMRLGDIQLSFPSFLLALALLAVLGPSLLNVILVLAISEWVQYARVARGQTLVILQQDYIGAAKALGVQHLRLIARHLLPNTLSPIIVIASFGVARAIIAESSLSFLGVGVSPDVPTWGGILARGRDYIREAWWLVTMPGLAILFVVLGINVGGDWLRDVLDPHRQT
jgi:peptide/nickel transport system permease protein